MLDHNRTELLYKPSSLSLTAADNKPRRSASDDTDALPVSFAAEPHSSFHEILSYRRRRTPHLVHQAKGFSFGNLSSRNKFLVSQF
jgi:hypothetical protein